MCTMSLTQQQCSEFWNLADADGDGELTIQELTAAVKLYQPTISDKECCAMFVGIHKKKHDRLSKDEFMTEMAEKPKRSQALLDLFKKYDEDGNGLLNMEELRNLISDSFGQDNVDEVTQKFMEYSDSSGDGLVSIDEFKAFFG